VNIGELNADLVAALKSLPAYEVEAQRVAEEVKSAHIERDAALREVVIEASSTFARETWRESLMAMFEDQAVLAGLADELRDGPRADGATAGAIRELLKTTGDQVVGKIARNRERGRRLLEALAADPDAVL